MILLNVCVLWSGYEILPLDFSNLDGDINFDFLRLDFRYLRLGKGIWTGDHKLKIWRGNQSVDSQAGENLGRYIFTRCYNAALIRD